MGKLKENIRIFKSADIDIIVDYLHDHFFSFSEIKYDLDSRTLAIPLPARLHDVIIPGISKYNIFRERHPKVMALVIFHNVTSYAIRKDPEETETYFNYIKYTNNQITVICCQPVEILINVSELDIELIFTDDIVK